MANIVSVTQLDDSQAQILFDNGTRANIPEWIQLDSNGDIIDDLAAGAVTIADGASVALGHKADAANAATDTTPVTEMSVLKQISKSIQDLDTYFSATNITDDATHTVKNSAGILKAIIINTPVATSVITYKDGSTVKGTITLPGALLSSGPIQLELNIACGTSIVIVQATAASDITIIWK